MNDAFRVAAAEISDADLDTISGGLAVGGSGGLFIETPLADLCAGVVAVGSTEGLASGTSVRATAL
ncbi:hypothetical protein [Streptomyces poriticola]|uniref:hypothetical protein n=1 Tax=Streptomyces poriticola TaxID=3120506 RepID=UPI002FCE2C58